MSRAFLVDALTGRVISYDQLIGELNGPEQDLPEYVYSADIHAIFKAYLRALLFEGKMILLDSDFSADEILELVPEEGALGRVSHHRLERPIADLEDLVQRLRLSEGAEIGFFTSGTTGLPKRVDHTFGSLARAVRYGGGHAADTWAFAYNPTHIAGCQVFLQAVLNGNALVNVFGLGREETIAALEQNAVTHISATPTFYRMLLPAGRPLPFVRRVTFGGERLDPLLEKRLRAVFPEARFMNLYGSTEAGTLLAAEEDVFTIREGMEKWIRIEAGQIMVHRDMLGTFASNPVADDWYATGDMVEVVSGEPLRFRILHRDSELINVGGYKVNPAEVEAALRALDGVHDARVYGEANSVMGNLVCCDLVPDGTAISEKEIRQQLSQTLQPFKIPRIFTFVESIEQTRTGKLKRT